MHQLLKRYTASRVNFIYSTVTRISLPHHVLQMVRTTGICTCLFVRRV